MKLSSVRVGDKVRFSYMEPGRPVFTTRGYVVEKILNYIVLSESEEEKGITVDCLNYRYDYRREEHCLSAMLLADVYVKARIRLRR